MIRLYSKFKCPDVYKELNQIIYKLIEPMTEDGTFNDPYGNRYYEYENLLFNHLYEKTNLDKELNKEKSL